MTGQPRAGPASKFSVKTAERDWLLTVLAAASGSADGWSFFGLGHAFVANMTGNTVLLGIAVFHPTGDANHQLIALAGYVAGTAAGAWLNRRLQSGVVWARSVSWTLLLEALLLIGADVGWVAGGHRSGETHGGALLACVAVAIGLQSGSMVQLGIPGVVTTYITGTWTTLTSGLTLLVSRKPRVVRNKERYEERFELQAGILGAYLASAVLTGWAFHYAPAVVGAFSAAVVLGTGIYGFARV